MKRIITCIICLLVLAYCLVISLMSGIVRGLGWKQMCHTALQLSWIMIPCIVIIVCNIKWGIESLGAKNIIRSILCVICGLVLAFSLILSWMSGSFFESHIRWGVIVRSLLSNWYITVPCLLVMVFNLIMIRKDMRSEGKRVNK